MKLQRLRRRANLNRDHSLKNPRTFHLSYLRVDECSWKKIDQVSSAATDHCTSIAVSSARKARTSTRSFRFAAWKVQYSPRVREYRLILARDMALGVHGWPRRYLPRLRLGKYVDSVNRAHLGPYGLAKYQPIFTRARWILLTYVVKDVLQERAHGVKQNAERCVFMTVARQSCTLKYGVWPSCKRELKRTQTKTGSPRGGGTGITQT